MERNKSLSFSQQCRITKWGRWETYYALLSFSNGAFALAGSSVGGVLAFILTSFTWTLGGHHVFRHSDFVPSYSGLERCFFSAIEE